MWQFENVVVEQKKHRDGTGKNGRPWRNISLKINGNWMSTFVNADNKAVLEALNEGDKVNVNTEKKGQYENILDLEVVEKASPSQVNAQAVKNDSREHRIFYSGTQKAAVELVCAMLDKGLVPLSSKKTQHVEETLGFVNKVTLELCQHNDTYVDSFLTQSDDDESV